MTYARPSSKDRLEQVTGRALSTRELVALTGMKAGAQVSVSGSYITSKGEYNGHMIETAVIVTRREPGDFSQSQARGPVGALTIANFEYIVDGNPGAPYDASMLTRQIPTARDLGIQVISMKCRSGSDDWLRLPRMGFDAPIDAYLKAEVRGGQLAQLPAGVQGPMLRDVLSSEAGRRWWADQGEIHPTLFLDISKGSPDVKVLNTYIRSGGQ